MTGRDNQPRKLTMDDTLNWRAPRMAAPAVMNDINTYVLDDAPTSSQAQGSVAGKGVISFVAGMSEQNKEDIKNSFLFASLVADKQFHSEADGEKWYAQFMAVMQNCGWLIAKRSYEKLSIQQRSFKMDNVIIDALATVVGSAAGAVPAAVVLPKLAQDGLSALARNPGPVSLFESKSRGLKGGTFSVGACTESSDQEVVMALGTINYTTPHKNTKVLFWEYDSSSVELYSGQAFLVFNQKYYADFSRQAILQKLGDRARSLIADYDI
ncbi:hypothetical protein [Pseudomonas sp. R5(2019)]|uniref:hypothetical protein n=1 Tax=Pseudomonas sp. R5(2019) TaxID=2697566 RepID=UPI001411FCA0|nr:hypothetical protein [Pseudomonas sp. R5(2019)]NBA95112.1 hypothetical protein [Pseudomonas sp. R5(2019)]